LEGSTESSDSKLNITASYVQFFWIQHICVKYSFPSGLARLKDLNRYVYPKGKTGIRTICVTPEISSDRLEIRHIYMRYEILSNSDYSIDITIFFEVDLLCCCHSVSFACHKKKKWR
jgi:hypothetical protein